MGEISMRKAVAASAVLVGCMIGQSWGWSASGTVKNMSGTVLSGVAVSVQDSSGISVTTSAAGVFSIGSTTGLVEDPTSGSSWGVRASAGGLEIQSPMDGTLLLSLVDGSGRQLWTGSARAQNGSAFANLPSGMRSGAAILRVRHPGGEFDAAVTTGPEGARVASHIAAARALAANPVLLFSKAGYRDTSYAMTMATATNLSITMGDTGTVAMTCPSAKLASGDQTKTLTVKGVARTYILHVPSAYTGSSSVPMVVDFHPIGGSASGEESGSPFKALTDAEGVVTAYPNGLASPNLGQAWNVQGCCTTADDTDFARAVVADVEKVACINTKRVYAVGFSMGGGMTHFSACHLTDIFAAASPAAFDLTQQNETDCQPSRPITMVDFRSTGDPVVAYAGGHSALVTGMAIDFLGAVGTFQKWAALDQCTGSPSAADANGCSTYSTCAGGVQVTLCTKQGGGHDYGNATVAWPILKMYTLP
ncbi:MAG TPA: PHB depolymerase family esterase [Fibrobacteria bacterium]|nr:PHB depolymerase family esterase [Fibrobacteria bacterium]